LAAALDWTVPKFPDHITVVSDQLYDWMIRRAKKEKVTVVPAGILPEMFDHADPSRVRHLYPEGDPPIVMYVGVLNAFQRIDYLLRAFTVVAKARPDAVLCVVHPVEGGTYLEGHKALAEELGIADRVRWIGPHTLEDLPNHLAMANVTVVPRPSCPGHPVKLLNAMIARRAAVCFAGSAKFVEHEKSALVAPDHDWEALGEAILRLVNDPELAARLADNARETVVAHFDWRVICRKIEAIYDGIVERPADDSADRKLVQRAG
jgi:glycosyltransferase involved in cell wall biosynthesis